MSATPSASAVPTPTATDRSSRANRRASAPRSGKSGAATSSGSAHPPTPVATSPRVSAAGARFVRRRASVMRLTRAYAAGPLLAGGLQRLDDRAPPREPATLAGRSGDAIAARRARDVVERELRAAVL